MQVLEESPLVRSITGGLLHYPEGFVAFFVGVGSGPESADGRQPAAVRMRERVATVRSETFLTDIGIMTSRQGILPMAEIREKNSYELDVK